jgi:hypothetical protein
VSLRSPPATGSGAWCWSTPTSSAIRTRMARRGRARSRARSWRSAVDRVAKARLRRRSGAPPVRSRGSPGRPARPDQPPRLSLPPRVTGHRACRSAPRGRPTPGRGRPRAAKSLGEIVPRLPEAPFGDQTATRLYARRVSPRRPRPGSVYSRPSEPTKKCGLWAAPSLPRLKPEPFVDQAGHARHVLPLWGLGLRLLRHPAPPRARRKGF